MSCESSIYAIAGLPTQGSDNVSGDAEEGVGQKNNGELKGRVRGNGHLTGRSDKQLKGLALRANPQRTIGNDTADGQLKGSDRQAGCRKHPEANGHTKAHDIVIPNPRSEPGSEAVLNSGPEPNSELDTGLDSHAETALGSDLEPGSGDEGSSQDLEPDAAQLGNVDIASISRQVLNEDMLRALQKALQARLLLYATKGVAGDAHALKQVQEAVVRCTSVISCQLLLLWMECQTA